MYGFLAGLGLILLFGGYAALALYQVALERAEVLPSRTWLGAGIGAMVLALPVMLVAGLAANIGTTLTHAARPGPPTALYVTGGVLVVIGVGGFVANLVLSRHAGDGLRLVDALASRQAMGQWVILGIAGMWLVLCALALAGGMNVTVQPIPLPGS